MSTGINWTNYSGSGPDNDPSGGTYIKSTGMVSPAASLTLVFLDEAANSIDNNALGIFDIASLGNQQFWNLPASRHNNGCNVSFADGHAEYHKWKGSKIIDNNNIPDQPTTPGPGAYTSTAVNDPDAAWLAQGTP